MDAVGVVDVEGVTPAELAFHREEGGAGFVIDVVAVEPGEKSLFEKQFHRWLLSV